MSIVLDLQKHIIQNKKTSTELLREALLISSKLELYDFRDWINNELKGYEDKKVPSYRILRSELKFYNPYYGWKSSLINDEELDKLINTQHIQQPISDLEHIISDSDSNELDILLYDQQKMMLMKVFNTDNEPSCFINKVQIDGIIEQVKTALLEWTIKLEENKILGDKNMSFSNEEKKKAQQNIHIENFNGVMGNIDNLGNLSTGDYNHNITTINNSINSKLNKLIEDISRLDIDDKEEIIREIENHRENKKQLTQILGNLITRGAEIATIAPAIGELIKMLN